MALNAQILLSILAHETSTGDLSKTLRATPASYSASLTDGTSANQAQVVWSGTRTLPVVVGAPSGQTLALASLADTRDGAAVSVAITAVKAVYVRNSHATFAISLAGGPFPAAGVLVAAGGAYVQIDPTATGMATGTVTVTGTAGGTYDIVLIGEGSVT
jgi:hypothetical protein